MRLLIDTHVVFWALMSPADLSPNAKQALEGEGNTVFVSIASAWEMAIKAGLGKWPEAKILVENFEHEIAPAKFELLPIAVTHVRLAGLMVTAHRDPFDRLLAAQAIAEGLTLVTADAKLTTLGAACLW